MAKNLNEYYTGQGQKLPSLQERAGVYEQYSLGKAGEYKGTAEQNTKLLEKLQSKTASKTAPQTTPLPSPTSAIDRYKTIQGNLQQQKATATVPTTPAPEATTQLGEATTIGPATTPTTATPVTPTPPVTATTPTPVTPTTTPEVTQPTQTPTPTTETKAPLPTEDPKEKRRLVMAERKIKNNLARYTTGESLFNAVQSGQILEGTQDFANLAERAPAVIEQFNQIKKSKKDAAQVEAVGNIVMGTYEPEPKQTQAQAFLQTVLTKIMGDMDEDIADSYSKRVSNDPEYLEAVKANNSVVEQINAKNAQLRQLGDDVRKTLSGDTPESLIASRIAREAKPILLELQTLQDQQEAAQSEMNRILDENKDMFALEQEQRRENRDLAFQIYGTLRDDEIRQEDIIRADKLLEEQIKRADKSDTAEINRLKQAQIDNVKLALAQIGVDPVGETYDELLGELSVAIKNKPVEGKTITGLKPGDYYLDNGVLTQVPTGSSTAPAPSRKPTISSSFKPDGTFKVEIANGSAPRKSSRGYYECAMLVNDTLGTAMPDLHVYKLEYVNSNEPVVGGAFIEKTSDQYGHTGIVESINADGTLNIVETNYPLGSGVSRKTIDPSKRNIVGYYNPETAGQSGYKDITDIVMPEKTTEFKAKSLTFGQRMDDADKLIQSAEERFKSSSTFGEYITPRGEWTPNFLKSSDQQQFEQAQRNFINAVLRRESGAVISEQEFANARQQYFPQPGDSSETIEQKRRNREVVTTGMFRDAGKTESGEDIGGIYREIKSQRAPVSITEESYTPEEESMIRELLAAGATEEEIDQAINSLRS